MNEGTTDPDDLRDIQVSDELIEAYQKMPWAVASREPLIREMCNLFWYLEKVAAGKKVERYIFGDGTTPAAARPNVGGTLLETDGSLQQAGAPSPNPDL